MTTLLNNPKLRPIWFVLAAAGFAALAWFAYSNLGNSAAAATADRMFVDAQTGQSLRAHAEPRRETADRGTPRAAR